MTTRLTSVRVGAGISTRRSGLAATEDALGAALGPLDGAIPDLAFLFVAPQFEDELDSIVESAMASLGGGTLLGWVAGGVIGGDVVIRNLVGVDRDTGAIAISDMAEVGQTVQFQVRDAESAREDLRAMLEPERAAPVAGALLFSCNGRGQGLFGQPDHDIGAVKRAFGDVPVAGFFAAGELGPVAGRNFVHGFTASILLFRNAARSKL